MSNKIQIREGMFETNSSSMHTVVLRNDETIVGPAHFIESIENAEDTKTFLESNGLAAPSGKNMFMPIPSFSDDYFEYGRGFELLKDWEDKFFYLIASYHGFDNLTKLVNVVKKRIPKLDGIITTINSEAFKFTQEFQYLDGWEALYGCFGHIDHQSYDNMDNLMEALRKEPDYKDKTTEEIFDDIIFNQKFVIVVDSDESYSFEGAYQMGIFKEAGFTKILHGEYINEDSYDMTYSLENIENEFED